MDSLNRAIDLVTQGKGDRSKNAEILALLEDTVKECQNAAKLWQEYLDKPGAAGDQWTLVSWVGPERAKRLHETNLRAKANVERICKIAGPEAGRFVVLDEDVIAMAYRQLKPGETGPDGAKTAVAQLQQRMDYLQGLMQRVRNAKVPAAKKTGTGKPVKKKKTAKPAKKKAAPKKK